MNLVYNIIYNPNINRVLRNVSKTLGAAFPQQYRIHPSGKIRLKVEDGVTIELKTNQTSYVGYLLFWNGVENYEYSKIFIHLAKKVDVFYDIGASIGYYSILGAKVNRNLKVETFEPVTGPMIYCGYNVQINNLGKQVEVNPIALSDRVRKIDFLEVRNPKYPTINNLSGEHNAGTKTHLLTKKMKVESNTLDNVVNNKPHDTVDLIKIDTEGSEHLILKEAGFTITKYRPIIICELLYNRIEAEIESIMRTHDYEFYAFVNGGLKKLDTLKRDQDNGIRDCFFVHPTKRYLLDDFIV